MSKLDKKKIIQILKKKGVTKAGIFGSYARGEQTRNSDVDILVQIKDSKGFFALLELKRLLEAELKKDVDLIEYGYLHPMIKKQALQEEIRLI